LTLIEQYRNGSANDDFGRVEQSRQPRERTTELEGPIPQGRFRGVGLCRKAFQVSGAILA
jgi:hypothetical protein